MIVFCYNPTSWRDGPRPGGMADCITQPIVRHLRSEWLIDNRPHPGAVNVYYAHRHKYGTDREAGVGVFVSHGIADKAWRNANRMRRKYDLVFTSGPAWTRRLVQGGLDRSVIREVGYSKLDPIFNGEIPAGPKNGLRVVWAPTHGGGGERPTPPDKPGKPRAANKSTQWRSQEVLPLLDRFDVVEARHPRHRPDGRSTLAEYVGADVVIADGGSTIYEAWALGIPVVFCDWLTARPHTATKATFESRIYRNQIGYHAHTPDDLAPLIEKAAGKGMGAAETKLIDDIFPPEYRGVSGRLHAEALEEATA